MSENVILFPGQGAQYVGMAKDFYENHVEVKEVFDQANDLLGFDLKKICFEGPDEALTQTINSQPAIYVTSWAIYQLLLKKNLLNISDKTCFAGLSLGEFTAHTAAGTWGFEEGLLLVQTRAQLMQKAAETTNGAMASVLNLDVEVIDKICQNVGGIVQSANYNSRTQIVISGEKKAVEEVAPLLMEAGARRVIPLNVSGAFHSPLMKVAEADLRNALDKIAIRDGAKPVYSNVTGDVVEASAIKGSLVKQLTAPVLWYPTIERLIERSYKNFVEVGPNKVLAGLIKRIDKEAVVVNIDKIADMEVLAK